MAQRGEELGSKFESLRLHGLAIFGLVGMTDAQSTALAPRESELAATDGAMKR
jgi:hypothetical protein